MLGTGVLRQSPRAGRSGPQRQRRGAATVRSCGRRRPSQFSRDPTTRSPRAHPGAATCREPRPRAGRRSARCCCTLELQLSRLANTENWGSAAQSHRRVAPSRACLNTFPFAYLSTSPRPSQHDLTGPFVDDHAKCGPPPLRRS